MPYYPLDRYKLTDMKPITAAIFIKGLSFDKPVPVENFAFTSLDQVKSRLCELQKGYCEGKEKITIIPGLSKNPKTGKIIKCVAAVSESDFSYVAYLAMRIKESALPVPSPSN